MIIAFAFNFVELAFISYLLHISSLFIPWRW